MYDIVSPALLRFLGATMEEDVKLGNIDLLLDFPSNLLACKRGVTAFGGVILAPFEVMDSNTFRIDHIYLGSNTNLGNGCILMPGVKIAPYSMIGTSTLIVEDSPVSETGTVLIGIPGHQMPFAMPNTTSIKEYLSPNEAPSVCVVMKNWLFYFSSKVALISLYWFFPVPLAIFLQVIFLALWHQFAISELQNRGQFAYSMVINWKSKFLTSIRRDFTFSVAPFISRTKYLVLLYRMLGARIGYNVLLSDFGCLSEPEFTTLGSNIRFNSEVLIQV